MEMNTDDETTPPPSPANPNSLVMVNGNEHRWWNNPSTLSCQPQLSCHGKWKMNTDAFIKKVQFPWTAEHTYMHRNAIIITESHLNHQVKQSTTHVSIEASLAQQHSHVFGFFPDGAHVFCRKWCPWGLIIIHSCIIYLVSWCWFVNNSVTQTPGRTETSACKSVFMFNKFPASRWKM